jgi:hypothetical protein
VLPANGPGPSTRQQSCPALQHASSQQKPPGSHVGGTSGKQGEDFQH